MPNYNLKFDSDKGELIVKKPITQNDLIDNAKTFCSEDHNYKELFGVTDGKAVGTFIEQKFQDRLVNQYTMDNGNAAKGLDIPSLNTDIKVTSIKQPQSSCPFNSARQKIYGLGYNLIVFVYEKIDDHQAKTARLNFISCAFIDKNRTADFQTTRGIREILSRDGNTEDIIGFLQDRNLPGDDITYKHLAEEILTLIPEQGYLTISNALQWRLQYARIVNLTEKVSGIIKIV
jgi:hypothetical protein